jgi:hypothetical protein
MQPAYSFLISLSNINVTGNPPPGNGARIPGLLVPESHIHRQGWSRAYSVFRPAAAVASVIASSISGGFLAEQMVYSRFTPNSTKKENFTTTQYDISFIN